VWFLEAEPGKHPVIIINCWIGISGHLEIIGAFSGARRCRSYGRSDLREIALRLFWTSCYVFIYFTTVGCVGLILFPIWAFSSRIVIFLLPSTQEICDRSSPPARLRRSDGSFVPSGESWRVAHAFTPHPKVKSGHG